MIDPKALAGCSPEELAMFACCVHGKNADVQAEKLNGILEALQMCNADLSPLSIWMTLDTEEQTALLRDHGIGQYNRIAKAWNWLAALTPPYTVEMLLKVPGIGSKTARFITVYSGTDTNRAILDVHVMRWLRRRTRRRLWPTDSTPSSEAAYARIEKIFLAIARKENLTPAELDTKIWKTGQRRVSATKGHDDGKDNALRARIPDGDSPALEGDHGPAGQAGELHGCDVPGKTA